MQTTFLSLVMGHRGSGVSTLLKAFAERSDMLGTVIIDHDVDPMETGTWLEHLKAARLGMQSKPTSRVVLASSDLKAPRRLLRTLAADAGRDSALRLDGVTLVGAATETADIGKDPDFMRATAIADRIVLTKTDQQDPARIKRLASYLKTLNPRAPILRARFGDIGPARLVDSGLFDPVNHSIDIDRWLCEAAFGWESTRRGVDATPLDESEPRLRKLIAAEGFRFFAITWDQPISSAVLSIFLKLLMVDHGADLLRLKGIVAVEDYPEHPALIDGIEHIVQPLFWLPYWPTADRRSRLVFVTTDISETWIKSLLTVLSDQLGQTGIPELQLSMLDCPDTRSALRERRSG